MGEKRSNHTVYNVNYHFVWLPKYRHAILEPIEDSLEASFRDVCNEYDYDILSSSEDRRFS
jgi:putative transposase